jgi:hypothetical protein
METLPYRKKVVPKLYEKPQFIVKSLQAITLPYTQRFTEDFEYKKNPAS